MSKTIYFAGGCFWGVQAFFDQIEGVIKTEVGYSQGTKTLPTYYQVCSGRFGFVETVQVIFDPKKRRLLN